MSIHLFFFFFNFKEAQFSIIQYRLFVFTCGLLLVHVMCARPYSWLSLNACYHGGHIGQHWATPALQNFLNVSQVVCKTLFAFENWVLSAVEFPWHIRETQILPRFILCALSPPNPLCLLWSKAFATGADFLFTLCFQTMGLAWDIEDQSSPTDGCPTNR